MEAGGILREARLRAGLTQRGLAERSGSPQSVVARIESGAVVPRVDTLERLLRACGFHLRLDPLDMSGVDRTQIDRALRMEPDELVASAGRSARNLSLAAKAVRR